jgi:uncharacterized SAM-binding protein YcdF (DUF218 family)
MGAGACLAIGAWLALGELGVLGLVGLGTTGQLPLAAAGGVLLGILRVERLLWGVLGPASAALVLVGTTDLVRAPINRLVRRDPLPAQADAVVVLSGLITRDGRIGEGALSRLVGGVEVIRAGVSSELVLTRLTERHGQQVLRSDGDQTALTRRLVPSARLHLVGPVGSTRAEAVAVADLAGRERWHRVVLITAPIHSRRACATFERAGLTVSCHPAEERKFAVESLPSPGDRIPAFREWLYERVAWVVYRWRGWVR